MLGGGTRFHAACGISQGVGNFTSLRCFKKFASHWTSWGGFSNVVRADREAAQPRIICHLRQTAVEAPEQLGRAEQHGGIFKSWITTTIGQLSVVGKEHLKQCLARIDQMRHGGFSSSQWVFGRQPRRPGLQGEEDEWGLLGVLTTGLDSSFRSKRSDEIYSSVRVCGLQTAVCSCHIATSPTEEQAVRAG